MYRDVERLNQALSQAAPPEPNADSVSYWRSYDPVEDAPGIADRAAQRSAEYASGIDLAEAWDGLWREVVESAAGEDRSRVVSTWGPTLTLDEYLKTRVLEVTVHRMDLEDALGQKGWGTNKAVSIVDDTLEGLLGEQPPSDLEWDVVDFIEVGTGRRSPTSGCSPSLSVASAATYSSSEANLSHAALSKSGNIFRAISANCPRN